MPTYQYQCLNCKSQFDLKQSFQDKPIAYCPTCHGTARRIFCPVPVLFKGPGFYVTDSREGRINSEGLRKNEKDSGGI